VLGAVVGLPLALVGAVVWAVPFQAVHAVWRVLRPERDVGATVKVLASLVFFPLWFAVVLVGCWQGVGPGLALLAGVVAPGAGLTTRHYVRRRSYALRALGAAVRMRLRGRALQELLDERDALGAAIDGLAARVAEDGLGGADDAGGRHDGSRNRASGADV
jgi:hypothetical protein